MTAGNLPSITICVLRKNKHLFRFVYKSAVHRCIYQELKLLKTLVCKYIQLIQRCKVEHLFVSKCRNTGTFQAAFYFLKISLQYGGLKVVFAS